LHIVSPDQLK